MSRLLAGAGSDSDSEVSSGPSNLSWSFIEDLEDSPYSLERRCTDLPCCLVLLLFLFALTVSMIAIFGHVKSARQVAQWSSLGTDICKGSKKVFFCVGANGTVDFQHFACVDECPKSRSDKVEGCPVFKHAYETDAFNNGDICRPSENVKNDLTETVDNWLDRAHGQIVYQVMIEHWGLISTCAAISVASSYVQLLFLNMNAAGLVTMGMMLLTVSLLLTGFWFSGLLGLVPLLKLIVPRPPQDEYFDAVAFLLILAGGTSGGILFAMRKQLNQAVACLEMAFICVTQVRATIMHPLLILTLYFGVFFFHVYCFVMWRVGLVLMNTSIALETACLSVIVVSCLWMTQCVFTYAELVLDYITAVWCFNGGLQRDPAGCVTRQELFRAYWVPLRYHMGTVALGAAVVGIVRPIELTIGTLFHFFNFRLNPLRGLLSNCFGPCMTAWNTSVRPLSKSAYIDVVMSGRPFLPAAKHSQKILDSQDSTIKILNGATVVLQVCMVVLNAGIGAGILAAKYSTALYEQENVAMLVECAVIGGFVALPFALLFDSISDAILYCVAVKMEIERREHERAIPNQPRFFSVPCFRNLGGWIEHILGWPPETDEWDAPSWSSTRPLG